MAQIKPVPVRRSVVVAVSPQKAFDVFTANPRLVYLSMKGFLKGPYEHRGA